MDNYPIRYFPKTRDGLADYLEVIDLPDNLDILFEGIHNKISEMEDEILSLQDDIEGLKQTNNELETDLVNYKKGYKNG